MRVVELRFLLGGFQSNCNLLFRLGSSVSKTLNEGIPGWRSNQYIQLLLLEFSGLQAQTTLIVYVQQTVLCFQNLTHGRKRSTIFFPVVHRPFQKLSVFHHLIKFFITHKVVVDAVFFVESGLSCCMRNGESKSVFKLRSLEGVVEQGRLAHRRDSV